MAVDLGELLGDAVARVFEVELAVLDSNQRVKPKSALPDIDAMARFYQRVTGVKAADFVAASKSFGVDLKVRQADSQIKAMKVTGTPTLVVAGKYRVNNENLKSLEDIIPLVKYLVTLESAPAKKP